LLVDSSGNAYLVFNSLGDGQDIQLHKYNPSGSLLWSKLINTGSLSNNIATSLALSPDETQVALTGDTIGGAEWITALYDASTGNRRWLVTAAEGTAARDVVIDESRVYVTGQGSVGINAFLTLVAYDRMTGSRLWRTDKRPAGSGNAAGLRMAKAPDGSLVVTGQALLGFLDWYTVAFETNGTVRWEAVRDGGLNTDEIPAGVLVSPDGNTVVTGKGGPNLPGGFIPGVTAGYSTTGTLLWEAFSRLETVSATIIPNGDVCATGGYDALITCWEVSSTPTPTPAPITISGTISYCSNPAPGPVPNVRLTLTGTMGSTTSSDGSGNYTFSSLPFGGDYIVTPTKAALLPASAGINTVDVIATQRHFLLIGSPLSGCPLTAADVDLNTSVNTVDVVAIQRFFLGLTTGIANVGKYNFNPANRSYPGLFTNQTDQNYDALVFGDVASGFVHRLSDLTQDAVREAPATVATVALPEIDHSRSNLIAAVRASAIDAKDSLVGFQGDFTFDERMITFENEPVQEAGLTAGNWNVAGNILDGPGPIRTLRVSAFSNDFTPLSGEGTLFELRMKSVSKTAQGTDLTWAAPPDNFIFIGADLRTQSPRNAMPAGVTVSEKRQ
jgi:WD40 repeat protein